MTRTAGLLFGTLSYGIFFVTFLYAMAFVADLWVPRTIDNGPAVPVWEAVLVDLSLLGLFAVQHSGMARRGFKRWLTRGAPPHIERSIYVLLSSSALILLFWQWRPIPAVIWQVEATWAEALLYALCAAGWLFLLTATFVINHFDLFGLRQVWLNWKERQYTPPHFREKLHYKLVRHPLMLGFIVAFWSTPEMTAGHLLFAAGGTGYILIALQLEERDLIAAHGDDYRDYKRRVPSLIPWPWRRGQVPQIVKSGAEVN